MSLDALEGTPKAGRVVEILPAAAWVSLWNLSFHFPPSSAMPSTTAQDKSLISRSIILINGERVTLDLQRADSDSGSAR